MAIFKIQMFKSFLAGNREWTNVYLVEAADLNAAFTAAKIVRDHEIPLHKNQVIFTKARISDVDPLTSVFSVRPINLPGTAGNAIEYLPLFNTARVDAGVSGFGRPSRKYYRLPLIENDVVDGVVGSPLLTLLESTLSDLIADLTTNSTPWVDPQGQLITAVSALQPIQMRQLHRKRRRSPPAV